MGFYRTGKDGSLEALTSLKKITLNYNQITRIPFGLSRGLLHLFVAGNKEEDSDLLNKRTTVLNHLNMPSSFMGSQMK